jgi:hypothetical protein
MSPCHELVRWSIRSTYLCMYIHRQIIEILDLEDACWNKQANFFKLVSTLFCEVKRGFVDHRKIVPLK